MKGAAILLLAFVAGCASAPEKPKPAPERYRDAWIEFDVQSDAMLRAAGRNRLKVDACAGRANSALETMKGLLEAGPAERVAAIQSRFASLSRTIAADGAVSSGQERAVGAVRDEVARDFSPEKITVVAREPEPPQPAPADVMARWEEAHKRFADDAAGGQSARLVQDYSEVRAAMEAFGKTEEDRLRVERFLREYERIAELGADGKVSEQDLKGIPVLAADIRAAFGGNR